MLKEYVHHPSGSKWLLNGLIATGIGQTIFRLDAQAFEAEGRGPARTLLTLSQLRAVQHLNAVAHDRVFEEVRALSDDKLEQLALGILEMVIARDSEVPDPTKELLADQLTDAGYEMHFGSHAGGRSRLVGFCTAEIRERRLTFRF